MCCAGVVDGVSEVVEVEVEVELCRTKREVNGGTVWRGWKCERVRGLNVLFVEAESRESVRRAEIGVGIGGIMKILVIL